MSVLIPSGSLRGLRLEIASGVRPTRVSAREAVIQSLATKIAGGHVWDVCAGSGAVGLHAASWGAARVVFCESHLPAVHTLRHNLAAAKRKWQRDGHPTPQLQIRSRGTLLCPLSLGPGQADVLWMDPPYAQIVAMVQQPSFLSRLRDKLAPGGVWILEHARSDEAAVGAACGSAALSLRIRHYGSTTLMVGQFADDPAQESSP